MFVDEVKIFAQAGHGGNGAVAFHREAYVPKGGPSGGNGGKGGDVILEADHDLNNLVAQYYVPRLIAQKGEAGLGKGMDGHAGKDLLVKVPCGTVVWKLGGGDPAAETAQPVRTRLRQRDRARALELDLSAEDDGSASQDKDARELIADLTEHGQRFVLCRGGRGGFGNKHFKTSTNQAPRFAQPGGEGESGSYLFELRLIAHVALIGFPNAGKSTLLTAISRAHPRVAPYPFTTLHPQIGIVEYPDYVRLIVCDVPGLIEGAHQNLGLGHAFLRHIRRCRILVLLLDMAGTDGRAPWTDYKQLLEELGLYDRALLDRPRLVVANKMDEPAAAANLRQFKRKIRNARVLPIAAAFDEGIPAFKDAIRKAVEAEASLSESTA
jgi:GTP-binding protein